jgi:hypothetical protein
MLLIGHADLWAVALGAGDLVTTLFVLFIFGVIVVYDLLFLFLAIRYLIKVVYRFLVELALRIKRKITN